MDEELIVLLEGAGTFTEVFPAFLVLGPVPVFELFPGPEDRPFRPGVEPFRIEQGPLIVISQQAHRAVCHDGIDALPGIGAVSDDISKTENLGDVLSLDVGHDGFQSFQIAVYVTDDRAQLITFVNPD